MDTFYEKELSMIDRIEKLYVKEAITLERDYTEYMFEHDGVLYESEKIPFTRRIKNFFIKLIKDIELYFKNLAVNIDTIIKKKNLTRRLKNLKQELSESDPNKTIEMIDAQKLKSFIGKSYKELSKMCDKFSKIKYTDVFEIDKDIADFNDKMNDYYTKLAEIGSNKKKVKVKDALEFVTNELSNRTDVLKYSIETVSKMKEMELVADNLQSKVDSIGRDVIPKHIGFIQRMAASVAGFIKKCVSKFIFTVVFLFA